jgi:hypothetical protein
MHYEPQATDHRQLFGRFAGSGLVAATGAIHLDLYLTGYRSIPIIGWLFLLQVIAAFGFAVLIAATRNRLVAATGAGFSVSTLGGYLLSLWTGVCVADTVANRIAAVEDGLFRSSSAGVGTTVSSGDFLSAPLGLVLAIDGDLLSVNGGNGEMVESTLTGGQPEWPTVDNSGSPAGAGALLGLAIQPGGKGVYFVDDATNTLDILK